MYNTGNYIQYPVTIMEKNTKKKCMYVYNWVILFKLKKVRKTTRAFRYDINQIPYTVEVTNRFQGIRSGRQSAWTMDRGS